MAFASLVLVGACGWLYPSWQGAFYPADLPEDWRLSYYGTRFQAVWLPAQVWQAPGADWPQWLDDTHDGFHFVLEPGDAAVEPPASARVSLATAAWEARHVWWLDAAPDLRRLAQRITQHAKTGDPLFVFSRSGNLGLLEQVSTLKQVMGY